MKKFWIASGAFFALLLVLFHGFVFDGSSLLLNADQLKGIGVRYVAQDVVLPQWDNSRLGGIPTLDAMFGDAYHPLRLLQRVMDPARAIGWKFVLCVQLAFMGGLLLFGRLAGSFGAGALVALLFALNPAFFSLCYPGHDGKMMVISALPWLLWGLVKLAKDGKLWGGAAMALALVWMLLSSQLQTVYFTLWGLLFLSLFLVFGEKVPAKTKILRQGIVGLAVAAALATASFQILPQRDYVKEWSVRGSAEKTTFGHAVSWSLHPEELASVVLPGFISRRSDVSSPDGAGIVEKHYWGRNFLKLNQDALGAALLILGFLGTARRGLRREAAFWLGASALVLAYVLGAHTPLFRLFYEWLPGVSSFRAPSIANFWLPMAAAWMAARFFADLEERPDEPFPKLPLFALCGAAAFLAVARSFWSSFLGAPAALLVVALALAALAALAAQEKGTPFSAKSFGDLFRGGWKAVPVPMLLSVCATALVLVFAVTGVDGLYSQESVRDYFTPLDDGPRGTMQAESSAVWASLVLFALVAAAVLKGSGNLRAPRALLLVGAAALADLLWTDAPFVDVVPAEKVVPPALKADWARLQKQTGAEPPNDYRLLSFGGINDNLGGFAGFRAVLGFHDNELRSFREFTGGQGRTRLISGLQKGDPAGSAALNLLNVRYVLAQGRLVENPAALPRVALYDSVLVLPRDAQLAALDARSFDERTVMLLEPEDAGVGAAHPAFAPAAAEDPSASPVPPDSASPAAAAPERLPAGSARVVANPKPDELVVETRSDRPAMLFHSENWMPGWRAAVDGNEVPVVRAFYALQAVPVPAGEHRVELRYRSPALARTNPVVCAGLLLLALLCGIGFLKRKEG